MKKISLVMLMLMYLSMTVMSNVPFKGMDLNFQCELIRQAPAHLPSPRIPVKSPLASINNHTLYINGATGCALQLVQNGEAVYTTVISSDILELPEELNGVFELQIIRGNYCFWAEIEL